MNHGNTRSATVKPFHRLWAKNLQKDYIKCKRIWILINDNVLVVSKSFDYCLVFLPIATTAIIDKNHDCYRKPPKGIKTFDSFAFCFFFIFTRGANILFSWAFAIDTLLIWWGSWGTNWWIVYLRSLSYQATVVIIAWIQIKPGMPVKLPSSGPYQPFGYSALN